ncbi:MAG: acetyl-CoA carboxylase biotin carboxylase subunit [Deltaproteobacteria bacterium]|nr:acetyl-CoA carboxylase biotin carboxylase subunit [Deltaproteobacteria bacterium]
MFKKVLVANRGEIAVRIMRACREMGITPVAVYSDVDRTAAHVRFAHEAYRLGPPPAAQSYLAIDRIIAAARASGVDAVHPGYGFLSENHDFARAVEAAGLTFIGPPVGAMALLGDKLRARATAQAAGVPVVPGTDAEVTAAGQAAAFAGTVGYPILLKASAGGGGKGMRVVERIEELPAALRLAAAEARTAFGDERIYAEKLIERPRHVEFQVLADGHGNVIHLGERECSIQRRHQKVIEESPSALLDGNTRKRMGEAAIAVARAGGYVNAGTIEFLVDPAGAFYFLEANTRLQVEHPVTEMVTGIDLVKKQIRIAAGQPLGVSQNDIVFRGAAIECRIYAEDPLNNFLPSVGRVTSYREPSGPFVRVDAGIGMWCEVSLHYDPIVAKVIAWGRTREVAINRMARALGEYRIAGIATTLPFHLAVMANEKFRRGEISTRFIDEEFDRPGLPAGVVEEDMRLAAAVAAALIKHGDRRRQAENGGGSARGGRWKDDGRRRGLRRWGA